MSNNQKIYLDYAASTPLDPRIKWDNTTGNAASIHGFGRQAAQRVDNARDILQSFIGASKAKEVIFTSGATESNNLIVYGVVLATKQNQLSQLPHVITSTIEHSSILEPLQWLEHKQYCTVTYIAPDKHGRIEATEIEAALTQHTKLVTIQYVNNEIGTVQPIAEIGNLLMAYPEIVFHTDAVQAALYLDCNVEKLGVDAMSLSAHKLYGPQGVGALYVSEKVTLDSMQRGGEQEFGKRAGTINVAGVDAFGQAVQFAMQEQNANLQHAQNIYQYLQEKINSITEQTIFNGSLEHHAPHILNYSFPNTTSEQLLTKLDLAGVAVSAGSACHAGAIKPSHVIQALNSHNAQRAQSALRISWGRGTSQGDIDSLIQALKTQLLV